MVQPTTYGELKLYFITASTPYVVVIDKRFYNGVKGGSIRVNSNNNLIGEGSGPSSMASASTSVVLKM